jgi:regulator of CtrA degradation
METQPAFFTRTYDETLDMIVEARNYMAHVEPRERRSSDGVKGLRLNCEALRVTSRLTQVLAWLMTQRAVHYGEITLEEACGQDYRLSGRDVCLDAASIDDLTLPSGLRSLLARSFSLYQRVSRLEEMVLSRSGGSSLSRATH